MKKITTLILLILTITFFVTAGTNREEEPIKPIVNVSWDDSMAENYKKPSDEELRSRLTKQQYDVTQNDGTERAFNNIYWDNHEEGIYVDIVSGEVLFSSTDKYDSKTGWPSFTKPIHEESLILKKDSKFGMTRVEVRSLNADSHLGHLFTDGPKPTGNRYCINSASLRLIPESELEQEGYGKYLDLFKE